MKILLMLFMSVNCFAANVDVKNAGAKRFSDLIQARVKAYKSCSCDDKSDKCKGNYNCPSVDFKTLKAARLKAAKDGVKFDANKVAPAAVITK